MAASPSPRLVGRVLRTFEQSPRLVHERFWLDTGPHPWLPSGPPGWAGLEVIGEFRVAGPSVGPLLLWDETVGQVSDLEALRQLHIHGNLAAWSPVRPALEFDARGLEPLDDAAFWPIVDQLAGRMWEKTIAGAVADLSRRDDEFILRWQETCARKALEIADTLLEDPIGGDGSRAFHLLGATIGKGEAAYEGVRNGSVEWDESWIADQSPMILHLGSLALERKRKQRTRVTTSFTPMHRSLIDRRRAVDLAAQQRFRERGGAGRREVEDWLGPTPSMEDVVALLHDRGHELSREGFDAASDATKPPHLRGLPRRLSMRGGRALIIDGDFVKMRIVLTDVSLLDDWQALSAMTDALGSFGGTVASPLDADRNLHGAPLDFDLFTIKRRFRGTRDEYLGLHVSG